MSFDLEQLRQLSLQGQFDVLAFEMKNATYAGKYEVRVASNLLEHGVREAILAKSPGLLINPQPGNPGWTTISWEPTNGEDVARTSN